MTTTVAQIDAEMGRTLNSIAVLRREISTASSPTVIAAYEKSLANNQQRLEELGRLRTTALQPENSAQAAIGPVVGDPGVKLSPMPDPTEIEDSTVTTVDLTFDGSGSSASPAESFRRVIPSDDWRARLSLAPSSNYLYRAQMPGILAPLLETDGVLFPYTPDVQVMYNATYAPKQMIHSNWEGKFYQGSNVGELMVTASFTAQDEKEARYMLAVLHFFKSATKMFYGQDFERGSPPPVLFFSAFGEYQFNNAPVLMHQFTLHLPKDVDYIQTSASELATMPTAEKQPMRYTNALTSTLSRLARTGIGRGGVKAQENKRELDRAPLARDNNDPLGEFIETLPGVTGQPTRAPVVERSFDSESTVNGITFVPTKIDITLSLHPLQSRAQMSKEFSLKEFANGSLIKRGFW